MGRRGKRRGAEAAPKLRCPVCEQERPWADTPFDEAFVRRAAGWAGRYFRPGHRDDRVAWACRRCLAEGRAQPADRERQRFGLGGGVHAYADLHRACRACGAGFVFGADEQRHWYETLGFFIDSTAWECSGCRAAERAMKRAHDELARRLHALDPDDAEQLEAIAALYREVGSEAKASEHERRAANARRRQAPDDP